MIIDSDSYASSGIDAFFFPGGEPHAKLPDLPDETIHVWAKLRTWSDVGLFLAVTDALVYLKRTSVFMPYFPGARQDRLQQGMPYTRALMAEIFNLSLAGVTVADLHSRYDEYDNELCITELPIWASVAAMIQTRPDALIAPDKGATGRVEALAGILGVDVVYGTKKRDPQSGKLFGTVIPRLPRGHYLVVDDICDGGATFNAVADVAGACAATLDLYVTHGIFSKGLGELLRRYRHIYTTDSWYKPLVVAAIRDPLPVTTLPLLPIYKKLKGIT